MAVRHLLRWYRESSRVNVLECGKDGERICAHSIKWERKEGLNAGRDVGKVFGELLLYICVPAARTSTYCRS